MPALNLLTGQKESPRDARSFALDDDQSIDQSVEHSTQVILHSASRNRRSLCILSPCFKRFWSCFQPCPALPWPALAFAHIKAATAALLSTWLASQFAPAQAARLRVALVVRVAALCTCLLHHLPCCCRKEAVIMGKQWLMPLPE